MNRYFPLSMLALIACGGDGPRIIEPGPVSSDISSLSPGEYRVFTPSGIPNGIELPSVPDARDFVIIVGNTSPIGDVEANYVVRGNVSPAVSLQARRIELSPQVAAAMEGVVSSQAPQRALE